MPKSLPWCIAHRGARDEAPENTISAFERALRYPIDGIELDVQMSADGAAVVYHDATLYRVIGRRFPVASRTRSQLAEIDWGRWFDKSFAGEPLNTLEQTLTQFGARTRLLIEIKSSLADRKAGRSEALTRLVIRLLAQKPEAIPNAHIHVLSFDSEVLSLAHGLAPHWRYVLNVPEREAEKIMAWPEAWLNPLWGVDVRIDHWTPKLATWAKARGLKTFTYTCNTTRQVQKALGLNLDGIISDRPGWLNRYLAQRRHAD
ncbi:MAG: glycerophosphodiester phosphodiesterase [Desulfobacteraceae bacterium]|nr:glycerophosphodiester phosphodiesterase [Desulfobacteraceae bacterium]